MRIRYLFLVLLFSALSGITASAAEGGQVTVSVRSAKGVVISGATVRLQDRAKKRPPLSLSSDGQGTARFEGVSPGDYVVEIAHPDYENDVGAVTVSPVTPASYEAALDPKGKEMVIKVRADRLLIDTRKATGNSQAGASRAINQQKGSTTVQDVASTTAGIQSDSLGQFHARGEHKGVSVAVDGVSVPVTTEDATSQLIDPRFLESMDIQTGFFDTSVGGQLGAVVNVSTKEGGEKPYVEFVPRAGTYGTVEGLLRAGGSSKSGDLTWFVGTAYGATDNKLEPVSSVGQTLNNRGADTSALVRVSKKTETDTLGLTLSYSNGRYGVSQTPQNFAAGVRQQQNNVSMLGVLSWKRAMADNADFLFGLSYLKSRVRVTNNGVFTPFTTISDALSPELAANGQPADPENPGAPYLPTTTLDIVQVQPSVEFDFRIAPEHTFKMGAAADFMHSRQVVDVIDAGGGGQLPNPSADPVAPTRFTADVSRPGFMGGAWFSHTFPVKDFAVVNWGVRADGFDNGAGLRTGAVGPRVNVVIPASDTAALRFSYSNLFQAPPLEIDPTGSTTVFPQRSNVYEASYEFQPAKLMSGRVALVYKDFHNQVDVGLLIPNATIPIFAPVNFERAFYKGVEVSLSTQNPLGWNGFLSSTVGLSRPTAPGPFSDELPHYNDHDQRVQVTGGASYAWKNGWSASVDALYASGYPLEFVPLYNAVGIDPFGLVGSRHSRFITNLRIGFVPRGADGKPIHGLSYGISVQNLFDNRSVLNFLSEFSGTRWVQGRRILLNGTFRF